MQMRNEGIAVATLKRPGHQPDLHRGIGHAPRRTRRFEIDGGEEALVDEFHGRIKNQESREEAGGRSGGCVGFSPWRECPARCIFSMFD
jgi:hypothetical protein